MRKALLAVHGLAAFAALANGLPVWGKAVALALVLLSAWQHLQRANSPVTVVTVDAEGKWRLTRNSGREIEADLLPATVVTRALVLLHLRDATGRFHALLVLPDSLDAESYRRLCARLRAWSPYKR
jgi:hypothetical protein